MKAKDVMTRYVVSVEPQTPLREAIARMVGHRVSGMPVVDAEGKLVGIVTEGDFVRRVETGTEAPRRRWLELLLGAGERADEYARAHGRTVQDVMASQVVTVGPEASLGNVVRLMEEHAIKRVPVVEGGRVVGIVSRADLMFALGQQLGDETKATASDATIRRRILAEMRRQTWCPFHTVRVGVRDGVVDLQGEIFDERERRALQVLAGNVEGVKRVDDGLVCIGSGSGDVGPGKRSGA